MRYWVVVPQIAVSLVLLLVAGAHVRALMNIELARRGYNTDSAVVLSIARGNEPAPGVQDQKGQAERLAERSRNFYRQLVARITALPGIPSVALSSGLPLYSRSGSVAFTAIAQEQATPGERNGLGSSVMAVSPGYFRTMDMALLNGRDFDERDAMTTPRVAVISERIAQRLWPGRNPIGRFVAAANNYPARGEKPDWLEVIGVVNEVDPVLRDVGQNPIIYVSLGQQWSPTVGRLIARVDRDPQAAVQQLKQAVAGAEVLADVYQAQTMKQIVAEILYPRRLAAAILMVSGLAGLLLASIGLYGMMSYSLAQRIHEIGVRTALGASKADILRMVIAEGLKIAVIGSAIGGALTYAAFRITANMFAARPAMDPPTFAVVPLALGVVVLFACYIPALRAARVDPMTALRVL